MTNNLPKLAIVGYGSMGKEIERIALERGFSITEIFDIDNPLKAGGKYDFDVAVDFSLPNAVISNIEILTALGKNIVLGTTGWYDKKDMIEKMVADRGVGLVYGSNFSTGMQMFFRIVERSSKLINFSDEYDIMLHEMHHHRKVDSPSGSAKTLGDIIIANVDSKSKTYEETAHEKIDSEALHISSTRGGEITGTHTVYIDSGADTLELTHRAKNRSGFAGGAVKAAEWIHTKKGMHDFSDMLAGLWGESK